MSISPFIENWSILGTKVEITGNPPDFVLRFELSVQWLHQIHPDPEVVEAEVFSYISEFSQVSQCVLVTHIKHTMPPALRKDDNQQKKRDRKSLSYDFKREVLKRLESGVHRSVVGRELGLADSTIRHIVKCAHKINNHFSEPNSSGTPQRFYARVSLYDEMDKRLYSYIENMKLQNMTPITPRMICEEAKRLFTELKESHKGPKRFCATSGWYNNFERRAKDKNIDIKGISPANVGCAVDISKKLREIIDGNKYSPKVVFSVSVTDFFWKRFPSCISSLGHSDYSSRKNCSNDKVTLLLGCNADGDCLLTPLIISHSDMAPNTYSEQQLVIWRCQPGGQVSRNIFEEWYLNNFCPFVKQYCLDHCLETKVLLLLSSSLNFPVEPSSNIAVDKMFVPSTIELPIEKVFPTFKAEYYNLVISQMLNVQCQQALYELESFDVSKSITAMSNVWRQMEPRLMNSAWSELCPQIVTWASPSLSSKDAALKSIIEKISGAGFSNISMEEVEQMVSTQENAIDDVSTTAPSVDESVIQDDYDNESLNTAEESEEQQDEEKLTTEVIETALNHIDTAFELLERHDSDWERVSSVRRIINDGVASYKEILIARREKPKQNTIYGFFKSAIRKSPSPSESEID